LVRNACAAALQSSLLPDTIFLLWSSNVVVWKTKGGNEAIDFHNQNLI
jgi:hypothetical protein